MTDSEKSIINDLLDACKKSVDSTKTFTEQVEEITQMMKHYIETPILEKVKIDDPDLIEMIKSSVVVLEKKPIVFSKGYNPWLNDKKASISWKYYNRYEKYLLKKKKWNWGTIASINESTDLILDHMKNPKNENFFGSKGLVMGDIQSGKTANYTALINKSLDAGYKLIIVLAGLTKDLRSQTQKRLDQEVLGYETRADSKKGKQIGVGLIDSKVPPINAITHSGDTGDLKKSTAEAITTTLSDGMTPLIAVLKKNSSVLTALIDNVLSGSVGAKTDDKFDVPVLIIDDEVDQASINTKKNEQISEASSINGLIRTMLSKFNRFSYVGYTATPFANVFINPYGFEKEEEKDIFPEDFIICLARPQNYCGVSEYFGIEPIEEDDDFLTLDLYKRIDDYYDLFDDDIKLTKKIKVDTPVVRINRSLHEAFVHFIIASAIKYARGIVEHNSMLIHIAKFKNPATSLRNLVKDELSNMLREYKYGSKSDRDKYKNYWEENIKHTSEERLLSDFLDEWENIEQNIIPIFEMSINGIKIVNGDSGDICDYESSDTGQHIIIGGDKLSRGLTLEGLIVTYYYRKSKTYDALLQMGRWFGYRNGWIDLCRIFTIDDFVNDFISAGIATEMFKKDIEDMNALKLTPADFGLKIRYSPKLAPTSYSKMRGAQKQKVSFSETVQQVLSYEKKYVEYNRKITESFLYSLNGNRRANGNIVYSNVKPIDLLEYLKGYKECDELVGSISIKNWIKYIEKSNAVNELTNWTVILHSNANREHSVSDTIAGNVIFKSQYADRNINALDQNPTLYLKAIVDQTDFKDFYPENSIEYSQVEKYFTNNSIIQKTFTEKHGVLAIYLMDIHKKIFDGEKELPSGKKKKKYKKGDVLLGGTGVIGLSAWFPKAKNIDNSAVEFYLNQVYITKLNEIDEEEEEI